MVGATVRGVRMLVGMLVFGMVNRVMHLVLVVRMVGPGERCLRDAQSAHGLRRRLDRLRRGR